MDQSLRESLKQKAELISVRAQQIAASSSELQDHEIADRMFQIESIAQEAYEMCPAKDPHDSLPKESKDSKPEDKPVKESKHVESKSAKSPSGDGVKR